MTGRQTWALLLRLGAREVRRRGDHVLLAVGEHRTVVPLHPGELKPSTLAAIERQLAPALGPGWTARRR